MFQQIVKGSKLRHAQDLAIHRAAGGLTSRQVVEGFELQLGLTKGAAVKVIKACHIWEAVVIEQGSLRVDPTSSHSAFALQTQCLVSLLVA